MHIVEDREIHKSRKVSHCLFGSKNPAHVHCKGSRQEKTQLEWMAHGRRGGLQEFQQSLLGGISWEGQAKQLHYK